MTPQFSPYYESSLQLPPVQTTSTFSFVLYNHGLVVITAIIGQRGNWDAAAAKCCDSCGPTTSWSPRPVRGDRCLAVRRAL